MMLKKIKSLDIEGLDTKARIIEAALSLFALKGFDGTSIREIAMLANVNVAAVNYHFKSKENLRQELMEHLLMEFKKNMAAIPPVENTAEYSVKVFEVMTSDRARCVNRFKIILEAENHPCEKAPYPIGFEEFSHYMNKDLRPAVPESERQWLVHVVLSYILHISVISSTKAGNRMIDKFFPKKRASIPIYIQQLVESLVRDLNARFSQH